MTTRGRFITLEGGEGAGKSTQARFVRDWLSEYGHDVVLTREPGGSPLAEAIRGVVLGDWAEGVTPSTEVLLMFAARAAHWHTTIAPALAAGRDVVCDRFVDSSYAYQGAGKGVSATALKALEKLAVEGKPDLTLLLDLDPEEGLKRAQARGDENRFEQETLDFMRRVREGFLARAKAEPQRIHVIDAARDADTVSADITTILAQLPDAGA
ncbi:MAG TPA: dTMP kinase [Solimonas sp.]|nr:dTMP kinase [Solimonas sp.]